MFVASVNVNQGIGLSSKYCNNKSRVGISNNQKAVSFKGDPFSATVAGLLVSLAIGAQNNAAVHKAPEVAFCLSHAQKSSACDELCTGLITETNKGVDMSQNLVINLKKGVRSFCKLPGKHK